MAVVDAASVGVRDLRAPSLLLALTEGGRALTELATLQGASPLLSFAPRGDGHPVMVLPGFLAGGGTTGPLRRFLKSKNYEPYCWGLGRNLGPLAIGPEGDFTTEEIGLALQNDFLPVSLGDTRLRTETAGIVAATLLANLY